MTWEMKKSERQRPRRHFAFLKKHLAWIWYRFRCEGDREKPWVDCRDEVKWIATYRCGSTRVHRRAWMQSRGQHHHQPPACDSRRWRWSWTWACSEQNAKSHQNTVPLLDLLFRHSHTRLTALFPGLPRRASVKKVKTNLDFTEARDSEWQWHQLGHMQVGTLLQTDNHASTPPLLFYRPDALHAAQPTVSKHRGHIFFITQKR